MSAMSAGATTLRLDFDIFSMSPIVTGSPVDFSRARRLAPSLAISTSAGSTHSPFWRR